MMKSTIENLLALQELQFKSPKSVPNRSEQIEALRSEIPEAFLRTFDRFILRKKQSVSIVHNGVCGACHLQIAVGVLGALAFGQNVHQCGNCGRFLYLPEDEPVYATEKAPKPKASRPRREPVARDV
jgi:predicted  nucleic acid-binding Zn-ribbon protein